LYKLRFVNWNYSCPSLQLLDDMNVFIVYCKVLIVDHSFAVNCQLAAKLNSLPVSSYCFRCHALSVADPGHHETMPPKPKTNSAFPYISAKMGKIRLKLASWSPNEKWYPNLMISIWAKKVLSLMLRYLRKILTRSAKKGEIVFGWPPHWLSRSFTLLCSKLKI